MELFRVFDWDHGSLDRSAGGPLFVARALQGAGRHDSPSQYGAWYCSRLAISAVAESIKYLRGRVLHDRHFVRNDALTKAIVTLRLDDKAALIDLDDPTELVDRGLRPSHVATRQRSVTQVIARSMFHEGVTGLSWWSTLDTGWTNVTLFHERALPHVVVAGPPQALSTRLHEVRAAAERLGIAL